MPVELVNQFSLIKVFGIFLWARVCAIVRVTCSVLFLDFLFVFLIGWLRRRPVSSQSACLWQERRKISWMEIHTFLCGSSFSKECQFDHWFSGWRHAVLTSRGLLFAIRTGIGFIVSVRSEGSNFFATPAPSFTRPLHVCVSIPSNLTTLCSDLRTRPNWRYFFVFSFFADHVLNFWGKNFQFFILDCDTFFPFNEFSTVGNQSNVLIYIDEIVLFNVSIMEYIQPQYTMKCVKCEQM